MSRYFERSHTLKRHFLHCRLPFRSLKTVKPGNDRCNSAHISVVELQMPQREPSLFPFLANRANLLAWIIVSDVNYRTRDFFTALPSVIKCILKQRLQMGFETLGLSAGIYFCLGEKTIKIWTGNKSVLIIYYILFLLYI